MGSLDFAFWDVIPHSSTGTAIADDYDAHIRLAQRLEGLGWHSYFIIEHQNAPPGRQRARRVSDRRRTRDEHACGSAR